MSGWRSYYMSGRDLRLNEAESRERAVKHLELALEARSG